MSSTEPNPPAEHLVYSYLEFKEQLEYYDELNRYSYLPGRPSPAIDVVVDSALTDVLKKLTSIPWTESFKLDWPDLVDCKISVSDEEAGTIGKPNVDVIMAKSKPSSFGKGDQTVFDPSYRHGLEIAASDLKLSNESSIIKALKPEVMNTFYPFEQRTRESTIELYKLAVYEKGGHFDWHKDSTHGNDHHATLLIAMNTEWKGGQLKLRHNGVENTPDMHPTSEGAVSVVAFYTDVEHMVEPVEEGVRLVLQFDIRFQKQSDEAQTSEESSEPEGGFGGTHDGKVIAELMTEELQTFPYGPIISFSGNQVQLEKMVEVIKTYHETEFYEVGFPLHHLYRQASIQPKYLKGIDSLLYETLKDKFDVSLHPIILCHSQLYEDTYADFVFKFEDYSYGEAPPSKKKKLKKVFHLAIPTGPLKEISSKEYIEYVGNEAQPGETKYFAGGMFVRPKDKSK